MNQIDCKQSKGWLLFIVSVFCLKFLIFYLDSIPMFFLGDSASYINTALTGWIPRDRSFVYGFVIRLIAVPMHSLTYLIAFQVLASCLTAILAAYALVRFFSASKKVAFTLGLLCVIEPLQLFYERYVLTETLSLFVFAAYIVVIFYYLERPRFAFLAMVQLVGTVLISFRLSFLPIIMFNAVLLPLLTIPIIKYKFFSLAQKDASCSDGSLRYKVFRVVGLHIVFSVALTYALHLSYKQLNGYLVNGPPAYQYESGFFLLADWGPVIKVEDFPYQNLSGPIFGNLQFDLADRNTRGSQRWQDGGLIPNIKKAVPDPLVADLYAKVTAVNALKRDPLGVTTLALQGFADYWNPETMTRHMTTDRGDRHLPPILLQRLYSNFGLSAEKFPFVETVTNRYYFKVWPWYLILLCTPLIALLALIICRAGIRRYTLVVFIASYGIVAIASALIERPTIRYLHALGWLIFLVVGALISRIDEKRELCNQYEA